MKTTVLMTMIAAALLTAGCKKSGNNEKLVIPTTEELLGTWIYEAEYQKVDGEWKNKPKPANQETQNLTFGPDGHLLTVTTLVDKEMIVYDHDSWSLDARTGNITISGFQSGRLCGIDDNDVLTIYSELSSNPETGKTDKGEFLNLFKRALPANQRFVGYWEYVATYKKDDKQEKNSPVKWIEYQLSVPDRTILQNTPNGQVFRINTYQGETSTSEGLSYNIDSQTGVYVVRDKYQGHIVFMDDDNVRWYQDKVTAFPNGEVTEGEFYMHFRRVTK